MTYIRIYLKYLQIVCYLLKNLKDLWNKIIPNGNPGHLRQLMLD